MKKLFTTTLLLLIMSIEIFGGPGDTIVIQTFEFEGYPIGDGWLAPREGVFDFSEVEGLNFNKILAYYTLKCDESQTPKCGEWDYLSYLQLREHTYTGEHPNFKLYNFAGNTSDSISYMNDHSWKYFPRFEWNISYSEPLNFTEYETGTGSEITNNPFDASEKDKRTMFLWRANELISAGMNVGEITGIEFDITSLGSKMNRLTIRMKQTNETELSDIPDTTGFTLVYSRNTEFTETGWQKLDFTNRFNWNGNSNIILDIFFSGEESGTSYEMNGSIKSWNCGIESENDNFIYLNGHDFINVPVENLSSIHDEITVSFWIKGDPEIQPTNNSVFEARDANNNRILNVHLPWYSSSFWQIFWDAGNETGYDRINKKIYYPDLYEDVWHHWVFIKNAVTQKMKIYLDGEEWYAPTTWYFKDIGSIDTMIIGKEMSNPNGNHYGGNIDEFQVWDTELDLATIQNWIYKEIDETHPNFSNLKVYYKFNETDQHNFYEEISGTYSNSQGFPQLVDYRGERFKNFSTLNLRPNIRFVRHLSAYELDSELVIDSFPNGQDMIITYVQNTPDEKPVLDEILYKGPIYYHNYVYDDQGNAVDSTLVEPDETVYKEIYSYYTTDINEEITIPWELGRFITPYGNNLSLGDEGWTWIFDVTKFQEFLTASDVYLKAGNFQELLDLKFLFIEGTPPRDLIATEKIWSGNFQLNNFDNIVTPELISLNPEGSMYELHTTLTGHDFGHDNNNCGEFCSNIHSVKVNGTTQYSWDIMQECGLNPLFPQGGTWFYDRAGWCPGMPATVQELDITQFIDENDTEVELDYDIEYDPYGNYVTETFFVTYGDYNFTIDAEIEDIIAPNTFKLNSRFNPICGQPIIKIKNNGSDPLTSVIILYGITDKTQHTFRWEGSLDFGESEVIYLPAFEYTDFYESSTHLFEVTLIDPNDSNDDYIYNNTKTVEFETSPVYNNQIIIHYQTNSRYWENSYEILDNERNQVFYVDDFSSYELKIDTLELDYGCYEFIAYDTGGDGMYNWPSDYGTGNITFYDIEGNTLINLEEWFGHEIRHQFVYSDYIIVNNEHIPVLSGITLFPNPVKNILNVKFSEIPDSNADFKIIDITGKVVCQSVEQIHDNNTIKININDLEQGVFILRIQTGEKIFNSKFIVK